ncbi:MAG TPA: hypothetical protein PLG50_01505 [bacterium]|nr:hypothetical protein [bacterium]HQG44319.1 hypothetical protein [bacterium]HQI48931.1 hypothetical protein [bacterium]HQJ64459.1 hypothetical protein [bacterium]
MRESDEREPTPQEKFARYGVAESDLARVIIRFAEPMLAYCENYTAREEAISYAIFAWNLSLETDSERERQLADMLSRLAPDQVDQIAALMRFLLQRKEAEFADNRFLIVDYQLKRQGEAMQIEMTTKFIPR